MNESFLEERNMAWGEDGNEFHLLSEDASASCPYKGSGFSFKGFYLNDFPSLCISIYIFILLLFSNH